MILSSGALKAYRWFEWRCGRARQCYWLQKNIAKQLKVEVPTIKRYVGVLVDAGLLVSVKRGRGPNLYILTGKAVDQLPLDFESDPTTYPTNDPSKGSRSLLLKSSKEKRKKSTPENSSGNSPQNVTYSQHLTEAGVVSGELWPDQGFYRRVVQCVIDSGVSPRAAAFLINGVLRHERFRDKSQAYILAALAGQLKAHRERHERLEPRPEQSVSREFSPDPELEEFMRQHEQKIQSADHVHDLTEPRPPVARPHSSLRTQHGDSGVDGHEARISVENSAIARRIEPTNAAWSDAKFPRRTGQDCDLTGVRGKPGSGPDSIIRDRGGGFTHIASVLKKLPGAAQYARTVELERSG